MAIANADGGIVLTTKVDDSGLKQSTRNLKSEAAKLAAEYRKAGMTKSEAFKKAWSEIERTKKETIKTTKATKEYGEQVQKSAGTAKTAFSKAGGALNKLAKAAAAAFALNKIIQFSAQSAEIATTSEASIQRLIDIYGSASKSVGDFIDANAQALGMSRAAAASFSSVYGNLFSVWADQATNAELTNRYLNMTAVVASKTGRTVEDVQERIRSGLLGNTEAIEDLGIFVNVKTIEMTDAFQRMASGKSWEQLDAYTQQQIRSMAILEQATAKYGYEVAQTSALAKSQVQAAWQDFQATWGQVVNRVLVPVLATLTDILVSATAVMQMLFKISGETVSQGDAISEATENQKDLTEAVKETEKAAKKAIAPFDELATLSGGSSQQEDMASSIVLPEVDLTTSKKEASAFAESLSEYYSKIYKSVKKVWDSQPVQVFVKAVKKYLRSLLKFYKQIGKSIFKNTKELYFFVEDDLKKAVGVYSKIWEDFWGLVGEKIDEWSEPTTKNVEEFIETITELFKSIKTNIVDPVITPMFETMSWLWEKHISPFVDKIANFVGTLINDALIIYNEVIAPIIMWLQEKLAPAWAVVSQLIIGVFGSVIAYIGDGLNQFFGMLTGLLDFITGVFTGDWKKAWNGVKTIFKSVFDGLVGIVKYPLNLIIDAINALIAGLNKLKFEAPDWVPVIGGKSWGVNIPKIPKLAQGAVIPPNREFLAVLGDQKQGTNIEAPLETIKQAVAEVLAQINVGGGGFNGRIEVPVIIDGREIAKAVREAEGNIGSQTVYGGFANAY